MRSTALSTRTTPNLPPPVLTTSAPAPVSNALITAYYELQRAAQSTLALRRAHLGAMLHHGGIDLQRRAMTAYTAFLAGGTANMPVALAPRAIDPLIVTAQKLHTAQAFAHLDQHLAAGPVERVIAAELARNSGDPRRADRYLEAAIEHYGAQKKLYKPGELFRAAAELYRATRKESYRLDAKRALRQGPHDFSVLLLANALFATPQTKARLKDRLERDPTLSARELIEAARQLREPAYIEGNVALGPRDPIDVARLLREGSYIERALCRILKGTPLEQLPALLRLREDNRLDPTGEELLRIAELALATNPGSLNLLQRLELARDHQHVTAKLDPQVLAAAETRLAAGAELTNALDLLREVDTHPEKRSKLERSLEKLKLLATKAGVSIDDLRDETSGMSFAMAAAAAGELGAHKKALALGSDPAKDKNPINGATQAHYAALAVRPIGDGAPPTNTRGAELMRAIEKKIGADAMAELAGTRNTLSEHNVFTDVAFYRNNGAALYLLKELAPKTKRKIDFAAPTARGIRPIDLIARSQGSFSEAVHTASELESPLHGPDGAIYADAAALRDTRHRAWARERGLNEDDVAALIAAAEQHDFPKTRALIEKLELPGGLNARFGYMGQTLLHFNIMGQFGDDTRARAAVKFQQQALAAGADPTVREDRLMNVDPFIRAAALQQRDLAFGIATWVLEHRGATPLRAMIDQPGVNNGRTALIDAVYALDWEDVRRLRELGADPKIRAYDGLPLAEVARMNANAAGTDIPADLSSWLA
jgi:hypothetical protein